MSKNDDSKIGEKLGSAGVGALAGMGTDYVWSALKLPGYGKAAFRIGTRQDGQPLEMGYDDLIELGIGGVTVGVGYWKKRGNIMAGGVGFIGGILITKLLEVFGAGVTPVHPPSETAYVPAEKVEEEKAVAFHDGPPPALNPLLGHYVQAL